MSLPSNAYVSSLLATAILLVAATCIADGSKSLGLRRAKNPVKVIHVRKIVRKALHLGAPDEDDDPILLGPARTRLLWRRQWTWNAPESCGLLPHGLRGGPMLSFDLPLAPLSRMLSIEARFSSLEYVSVRHWTRRVPIDEFADPRHKAMGLEAGLYLNLLDVIGITRKQTEKKAAGNRSIATRWSLPVRFLSLKRRNPLPHRPEYEERALLGVR